MRAIAGARVVELDREMYDATLRHFGRVWTDPTLWPPPPIAGTWGPRGWAFNGMSW